MSNSTSHIKAQESSLVNHDNTKMCDTKNLKIGIVGCGIIGSGIAKSIFKELKGLCRLSGLYDLDAHKSFHLEQIIRQTALVKSSFSELLQSCDVLVEAINTNDVAQLVRQALEAQKHVFAASVGQVFQHPDLFLLAKKKGCSLLIPSGAIAGIDAIKSASLGTIEHITLTTRKSPKSLAQNPYFSEKGIDLSKIHSETIIFEGTVEEAVKAFPQNINVAATLALASQNADKIIVRIMTSPAYQTNSHEIEVVGNFGRITTRTDNVPSPENPKTSYLAVLSGIQTLKNFFSLEKIGT